MNPRNQYRQFPYCPHLIRTSRKSIYCYPRTETKKFIDIGRRIYRTTKNPEVRNTDNEYGNKNVDNAREGQELKLNQPKVFGGKQDELDEFLQNIQLYLAVNDNVYDSDKKKIAYTLSFMSEGDAKSWKGQYLRSVTSPAGSITFGPWTQLMIDLRAAF
jgi:ADP-heptose:LPS heptosyltransferase